MHRSSANGLSSAITVLVVVLDAFAGGAAPAGAQQPTLAQVNRIFARWDRPGSPGCAVGVVRDGRLAYRAGFGKADLDYGIPLSDSSVFYLCSVSKQFTAAAIAIAARKGYLSLDDDIHKYLPELPDYGTPITVSELVHHTSGIRDYLGLMPLAGLRYADVLTDSALLHLLARQRALDFPPGTQWAYSNSGYVLLSFIIRRATGKSLRQFADEVIFQPLGMKGTHFNDAPTEPIANRAIGYDRVQDDQFAIDYYVNFDKVGDGGLWSSVRDLFLWDQNFYHDRLGGPGFIDELTTPAILPSGKNTEYGFGLMIRSYRGRPIVEHAGTFMGYRTEILRFPQDHFSVIVLCNLGETNPSHLAREVADLYLADRLEARPAVAAPVRPPVAALQKLTGTYFDDSAGSLIEVSLVGDTLRASLGGGKERLEALAADSFRVAAAPDLELIFIGDVAAHASGLVMRSDGIPQGTYHMVELRHPSAAELDSLTGLYHSDELAATYNIAASETGLTVTLPIGDPISLRSPARDAFIGGVPGLAPIVLRFTRDANGVVSGFTVASGRIHGIAFLRR
jgi:CubicO group peptidase (beta-lactamase class C family)